MDLFSLLTGAMTSSSSLSAASEKTGLSSKQIRTILLYVLPILVSQLAKNASNKKGEDSLALALTQHNSTSSIDKQIKNADVADGAKIIGHIFGNNSSAVVNDAAKQTGFSAKDVSAVLNVIAPALLNNLSTASNASAQQGTNLGSLMSLFGQAATGSAKETSQTQALISLLSTLMK